MSDSPLDVILPDGVVLTKREKDALRRYRNSKEQVPLGLDASLNLYDMFLNGYSCEGILSIVRKQGKGFELGQILDARIRDEWDARAVEHRKHIYSTVAQKAADIQAEAVAFMADRIRVAHRIFGERLHEFMTTGNKSVLGELAIFSPKEYEKAVSLLMKLTGQDKAPVAPLAPVNVNVNVGDEKQAVIEVAKSPPSNSDMFELLKLIDDGKE